ncbi:nitrogenase component 1 [Nostoc sp. MS1]|uniref:nitrogenase component 1 n=1 Tax=Nostoc sp. MS1 TaxID=2764711 RepID=UPI001CC66C05|nr:nitrogenase component 1 [Nostoc sp. MS1]BCL39034.1 nitrogenase iron-molybdenum cofactor biosynthesis protein NifE [Nostoc sp. MS1]
MKASQEPINNFSDDTSSENQDRFGIQVPSPLDVHEDCAFEGAMSILVPITDAAHLIHGPSGCISNSWVINNYPSSNSTLHKVRFTTDMEESDIIFGGAKKLDKAILELVRRYKPAAVFVYSTCVSALIGDDINGVCKNASEQIGIPIIPVDSPGFVGRKNLGIRVAGEALLEHVIGTAEPELTTPLDINLIAEPNSAIWINILPLLEQLGIRVLAKITGDAQYQEICYAHRAKLNVIIDSKPLLKMVKKMEDLFDIPYIEESLDSVEDINQCLRDIVAQLGDSELQTATENLIVQEISALDIKLAAYRIRLQGKKVLIYTGGRRSWLLISTAKTLGMDVIPISSKKSSKEDRARVKKLLDKNSIILQQDNISEVVEIINHHQAQMLIASTHLQSAAHLTNIPFLDINQQSHHSYVSYAGIFTVAQELYATLYSPIWEQVRKAAPWE